MTSNEVRTKFLEFFNSKGHKIVASDTLVPADDPSVLFTSAGMNQFKEQFMGNITDYTRAASSQKCLRTGDLVNVGKSPTHHTFFEMLGNFSFGDYFKKEAILWAWEFVTKELKLPQDRLSVSVHNSDDEAYDIWLNKVGISADKVVKLGDKDNFWPANAPKEGPNGPCGPCSEIFFDWGREYGCNDPKCSPACDCKRFSEIWNLVFTQYYRREDGALDPLPSKNIDTGMGLERITSVVQNVRENYQTDLFVPLLETIKNELNKQNKNADNKWMDTKAKAVADHIRAACFAIADGVVPSNETRGYVIRKLIRRSIINLKQVGVKGPFCYLLVNTVGLIMEQHYPEIKRKHQTIAGIIKNEEEMFWKILNEKAQGNEALFKELSQGNTELTAAQIAFNQYDTFGVPLEISKENAQKFGIELSDEDFEKLMDEQRQRSRSGTQMANEIFAQGIGHLLKGISSEFVGYEKLETDAQVLAIIKDGSLSEKAKADQEVELVLDVTPFYAESGGQVGDTGYLKSADCDIKITNTTKIDNAILHTAKIVEGSVKKDDKLKACVTTEKRISTARNHTATHLLQYALRIVLGEHVEQSGSYVDDKKLRFDFTHLKALKKETIEKIENLVNQRILEDLNVSHDDMSIEQAKKSGALAFFGEKYGDRVKVLSIADISKEFCGGTHVSRTGQIGLFKIVSESSIAQGVRRIEAVTGTEAFSVLKRSEALLEELTGLLKTSADNLPEACSKLLKQLKAQEKELLSLKMGSLSSKVDTVVKTALKIDQVNLIAKVFDDYDISSLRKMNDQLKNKADPVVCVLGTTMGAKPMFLVGVSKTLVEKGIDANKLVKELSSVGGGGGGGRKELAQAGAKDNGSLNLVIEQCPQIIKKFLKPNV